MRETLGLTRLFPMRMMMSPASRFLHFSLACALSVGIASAASFPTKPIHLLIGFPAGGGSDVVARQVATGMSQALGQPVVVENRAGAGGNIAALAVAKSAPDGYTVYLATASNGINAAAASIGSLRLDYDFLKDLQPVIMLVRNQNVLVANPALPVKSLQDLIALARAKPGALNFGVMTPASLVAGELFRQMARVSISDIPYKGASPVVNDLIGGQVELAFIDVAAVVPHIQSGKLRALGVTSTQRFDGLPDVPTLNEAGVPGYEASGWLGLMVPAGTPPEVVLTLNQAAAKALADPALRLRLMGLAVTPDAGSSEQYRVFLQGEVEKWARVLRAGNITLTK